MKENIEIERKFVFTEGTCLSRVLGLTEAREFFGWRSTLYGEPRFCDDWYYDTDDFRLLNAGASYRARHRWDLLIDAELTFKRELNGVNKRVELSWSAPRSLFMFGGHAEVPQCVRDITGDAELLHIISVYSIKRDILLDRGSNTVVLSIEYIKYLDQINGGEPVHEHGIEVELKEGDAGSIKELGSRLAEEFGLEEIFESKYGRGLWLLDRT